MPSACFEGAASRAMGGVGNNGWHAVTAENCRPRTASSPLRRAPTVGVEGVCHGIGRLHEGWVAYRTKTPSLRAPKARSKLRGLHSWVQDKPACWLALGAFSLCAHMVFLGAGAEKENRGYCVQVCPAPQDTPIAPPPDSRQTVYHSFHFFF